MQSRNRNEAVYEDGLTAQCVICSDDVRITRDVWRKRFYEVDRLGSCPNELPVVLHTTTVLAKMQ